MRRRRINILFISVFLAALFFAGPVIAAEGGESQAAIDTVKEELQTNINIVWTCIAAFLVFFMQAGFD